MFAFGHLRYQLLHNDVKHRPGSSRCRFFEMEPLRKKTIAAPSEVPINGSSIPPAICIFIIQTSLSHILNASSCNIRDIRSRTSVRKSRFFTMKVLSSFSWVRNFFLRPVKGLNCVSFPDCVILINQYLTLQAMLQAVHRINEQVYL